MFIVDRESPWFYQQCNAHDAENTKLIGQNTTTVLLVSSSVFSQRSFRLQNDPWTLPFEIFWLFPLRCLCWLWRLDARIQIFLNNLWPSLVHGMMLVCTSVRFLLNSNAVDNGSMRDTIFILCLGCSEAEQWVCIFTHIKAGRIAQSVFHTCRLFKYRHRLEDKCD